MKSVVIIPAYNEEKSIAKVIGDIPTDVVSEVIVVNNNSNDNTETFALNAGATVLFEKQKGYGAACLKGIDSLKENTPDIVVFLDGDYSDYPEDMSLLLEPILAGEADFVVGSRMILEESRKALLPQARYGNQLAVLLIRLFFHHTFTDLGPFRAIRYKSLEKIGMRDKDFGWTVEMQIKAVQSGLRIREVPVRYRIRIGISKITGTVSGTLKAGTKIIYTIFKYLVT